MAQSNMPDLGLLHSLSQQAGESADIAQRGRVQAGNEERLARLRALLAPQIAGAEQAAKNAENLKTLQDSGFQDQVNEGGSARAGDLTVGGNPYARIAMQGPHEAQSFLKSAQGAYKGINDQLDSSKATLDALNLGNSTGDKMALVNEAKLMLAGGGSRAVGQIVSLLSGDTTMAGNAQKAVNWLQNTPSIPTLPPAQRDAIREAVFSRVPQVEQMHQQTAQQLAQQGPIVAPHADAVGLIGSVVNPAQQKLTGLKAMQEQYSAQRGKMQPQPPVSQPSQADANPTTLDRLKGFFSSKPGPQQPQAQQDSDPIAAELAKRAKQSLNQPQGQ